jgi:hypothetical protein
MLAELARPKVPLYVGVRFDGPSMDEIMKLTKNVPNRTSRGELHVTVAYSKAPISYTAIGEMKPVEVTAKHYSFFTSQNGETVLVLELSSDVLSAKHHWLRDELGASYDFEEYKPHVTLSYDVGENFDLDSLPPVDKIPTLYVVQEYAQKLDLDWGKKKRDAS